MTKPPKEEGSAIWVIALTLFHSGLETQKVVFRLAFFYIWGVFLQNGCTVLSGVRAWRAIPPTGKRLVTVGLSLTGVQIPTRILTHTFTNLGAWITCRG